MRISWRMIAFFVVVVLAATSLLISKLIRDRSIELKELPAPLLKPVTLGISAELGWQNTGILLESGETFKVQFMSGEIRDSDSVIRGPAGVGYICRDSSCCEPMPEVQRGALIGRVGDDLFLIGDKSMVEVEESGELQLRINDCDEGLVDNSGSLEIKISP